MMHKSIFDTSSMKICISGSLFFFGTGNDDYPLLHPFAISSNSFMQITYSCICLFFGFLVSALLYY